MTLKFMLYKKIRRAASFFFACGRKQSFFRGSSLFAAFRCLLFGQFFSAIFFSQKKTEKVDKKAPVCYNYIVKIYLQQKGVHFFV